LVNNLCCLLIELVVAGEIWGEGSRLWRIEVASHNLEEDGTVLFKEQQELSCYSLKRPSKPLIHTLKEHKEDLLENKSWVGFPHFLAQKRTLLPFFIQL
jgi:hypothetical protein